MTKVHVLRSRATKDGRDADATRPVAAESHQPADAHRHPDIPVMRHHARRPLSESAISALRAPLTGSHAWVRVRDSLPPGWAIW
eukprot:2198101-Prymnesium_polylepis.3